VIGLAASVAVGVGTYGLFGIADCAETGACDLPSTVVQIAFNGGLPVAMIAVALGGGLLVAGALFVSAGAGAIAAGVGGDSLLGWVLGSIFALVGVGIFGLAAYLRRSGQRPGAGIETLMRSALNETPGTLVGGGQPAVGTVLSVSDTGTTLNDDPLASLRLRVEPADGSASFEAVARRLVSRLAVPRPGDRFRVEYDPADQTRLAIGEALPGGPVQDSFVDQLVKLDELRRSGALTQSEFDSAKARLLHQGDGHR
jgi:hypothetical protein